MEIQHYKAIGKGSLVASFNVKIPKWGNFIIKDINLFSKGSHRWITFPSKPYEDKVEGKTKYFHYCTFEEREMHEKFQTQVLEVLDKFLQLSPPKESEPDFFA